jgi:hypothetical protein
VAGVALDNGATDTEGGCDAADEGNGCPTELGTGFDDGTIELGAENCDGIELGWLAGTEGLALEKGTADIEGG